MQFTYYGHSCFSIKAGNNTFLFDPFITGNELAKNIDVISIQANYILVSHGHYDHTGDLISIAKRTQATVISNFEIVTWAQKHGITKVHPMNFGTTNFNFGMLSFVQAQHSSSFEDGTYAGSPGGFIVTTEQGNFYYSGDTSLTLDMQLVTHYAKIDVAILPVGGNFTMNIKDAIKASDFIKCDNIIGVHFDTFGYIKLDKQVALKQFSDAGKKLLLPEIGKSYEAIKQNSRVHI